VPKLDDNGKQIFVADENEQNKNGLVQRKIRTPVDVDENLSLHHFIDNEEENETGIYVDQSIHHL
jgi:hypothetical protein